MCSVTDLTERYSSIASYLNSIFIDSDTRTLLFTKDIPIPPAKFYSIKSFTKFQPVSYLAFVLYNYFRKIVLYIQSDISTSYSVNEYWMFAYKKETNITIAIVGKEVSN